MTDESSYEAYKNELHRKNKKRSNLRNGKVQLILGIAFLLYTLFILPFHADNAGDLRADELKIGDSYGRVRVYYFDRLEILEAKIDEDGSQIYCIAGFFDRDRNECFTMLAFDKDEPSAESIRLWDSLNRPDPNPTVSGYFQLKTLDMKKQEKDGSGAGSFLSVYSRKYADADASNILDMCADYVCGRTGNYTLIVLCHPGIPLISFVAGLTATVWGICLLLGSRKGRRAAEETKRPDC